MFLRLFGALSGATVLRFAVFVSVAVWFGGFTFYSTAVISTTQAVLHSMLRAGLITQQVTNWLNWISIPTLLICAWNAFALRSDARRIWIGLLFLALVGMVLAQAALFPLHHIMDSRIIDGQIEDDAAFFKLHKLYLIISTAQWGATLVYIFSSLILWRHETEHTSVQGTTRFDAPLATRRPAAEGA